MPDAETVVDKKLQARAIFLFEGGAGDEARGLIVI
jgi:hypothetical protein